jgi:hypothetical protein
MLNRVRWIGVVRRIFHLLTGCFGKFLGERKKKKKKKKKKKQKSRRNVWNGVIWFGIGTSGDLLL